jgi:Zn-dependent protease
MTALLAPPPSTRYDLRFTLLGVPVRVHPLFWLIALLFGLASRDVVQLLIWVAVVFVSILVHEMGHALAMRRYGQDPHIVLHMMGGLTYSTPERWGMSWASVPLGPRQRVVISLAGPGAGFALAAAFAALAVVVGGTIGMAAVFGVLPLPTALVPAAGRYGGFLLATFLWVNLVWGLVNLLPVIPLDGGNIARQICTSLDPMDGPRRALWLSTIAGALAAVGGFLLLGSLFVGMLFAMLALGSYQQLRGGGSPV